MEYAQTKLKNRNWYIIAKGIRELMQFHIQDAHSDIIEYANHYKSEVRKEVQFYLVSLFHFKGLDFLDNLEVSLSEWDQIQLLEVLQKGESQEMCNVKPWLKSKNDSVVIFALKLVRIYNQFEVIEELIKLVNHPSEKVRIELILVLSYLNIFDAKDSLKDTFNRKSTQEQIAIFQLFENMFDSNDEPFILEQDRKSVV